MRPLIAVMVAAVLISSTALAAPKTKKKARPAPPEILTLSGMEIGQTGVLAFAATKPVTLLPLKIEDVGEGQFVGSVTSSATGKRTAVVVRGVKTDGVVSGRYFQLGGVVRVADTEELSSGETVFVLEPADPETFSLTRSESPALVRPR